MSVEGIETVEEVEDMIFFGCEMFRSRWWFLEGSTLGRYCKDQDGMKNAHRASSSILCL